MIRSPPLRFLAVVLGGWATLRTATMAPLWPPPSAGAAAAARPSGPPAPALRRQAGRAPSSSSSFSKAYVPAQPPASIRTPSHAMPPSPPPLDPAPAPPPAAAASAALGGAPVARLPQAGVPPRFRSASAGPSPRRWSASAWALARRDEPAALAAGGMLGGSQAGARLAYRVNRDPGRPLALSARLSAPMRRAEAAEAALGIDWRPSRRLPLHLLAERRQALGEDGRSAFALILYGGVSDARLGRFRVDAYAQAGLVGARAHDRFGDAAIRLSLPLGERARLGGGAWAAAQPGVSRLDVGPQGALRLSLAGRDVTVAADWRLRVAGDARPGSGPTLTLGTDF